MLNNLLYNNIKELCAKKNTTINKLEDEAGLARGTIYRWDKSMPSLDSVYKVAKCLNVTINRLLKEV